MGGDEKSADCLYNVAMLTFCGAILSMGTRTGKLRKSTMSSEKKAKHMREILPPESDRNVRMEVEN